MTLVPDSSHSSGPAFNGWTSDGANPSNVNAQGGSLAVADLTVTDAATLHIQQTSGVAIFNGHTTVNGLCDINSDTFNAAATAIGFFGAAPVTQPADTNGVLIKLGLASAAITSGALPTQQFASTVAAQVSTTRDVEVHTPVTFNSLIATIATCKVELSPDNMTFSTLCIWTEPVGVALAGTIHDVTCRVPAGWYLKLTVAQAVLGLSTYF